MAQLPQFLEAHFNERSAEDLCNAMTSLEQSTDEQSTDEQSTDEQSTDEQSTDEQSTDELSTDESIYAYVMRTFEIRQKVLLAAQKASGKGEIGFDKDLVMKLFLQTLEQGIISQYVVQEIRHLQK